MEIEEIIGSVGAKKSCSFKTLALILLLCLFSGTLGGFFAVKLFSVSGAANTATEVKTIVEERNYVEESQSISAIEKVNPAVVSVIATKDLEVFYRDPFNFFEGVTRELRREEVGGGSAFVVSADGMVITNHHVVSDKNAQYTALSRDGKKYDVEVLASDPAIDISLLQLYEVNAGGDGKDKKKPQNLSVVQFGESAGLKVGQRVLAIGNALGQYDNTVTAGIVSGIGREITAGDSRGNTEELLGLIQTDAAINPGNSGGPLVNLSGAVVGVNVAIDRNGANIGFAVPIDDVKKVVESFRNYGKIVRPVLGVRYFILDAQKAAELKLPVEYGALLVGDEAKGEFAVIPGSSADQAGLKIKDIILEVNGRRINKDYTLHQVVRMSSIGDKLKLKLWRSGKEMEIEVVLKEGNS